MLHDIRTLPIEKSLEILNQKVKEANASSYYREVVRIRKGIVEVLGDTDQIEDCSPEQYEVSHSGTGTVHAHIS